MTSSIKLNLGYKLSQVQYQNGLDFYRLDAPQENCLVAARSDIGLCLKIFNFSHVKLKMTGCVLMYREYQT